MRIGKKERIDEDKRDKGMRQGEKRGENERRQEDR